MIAYSGEHPVPGQSHPWTNPLAPADFLNPRPDWALQAAGALAPRPEDFPFTEAGKRDYYAAVEQAAHQQMAVQQQMMHHDMAGRREEADRAARQRRDHLLLLRR